MSAGGLVSPEVEVGGRPPGSKSVSGAFSYRFRPWGPWRPSGVKLLEGGKVDRKRGRGAVGDNSGVGCRGIGDTTVEGVE